MIPGIHSLGVALLGKELQPLQCLLVAAMDVELETKYHINVLCANFNQSSAHAQSQKFPAHF